MKPSSPRRRALRAILSLALAAASAAGCDPGATGMLTPIGIPTLPAHVVCVTAESPAPEAPGVVLPRTAIVTDAGVHHVMVVAGGRVERRRVQLGRELGAYVEVVRGVVAAETVVAHGAERLRHGARVAAADAD